MSTINEQIVTGRAHRVLIDKVAKLWQRISFWTKASDVEFNDGNTAETKVGAIKGITTDLNTTETGYAADMTALAQLNSDISVRYNAESDYIQIYNGAQWIDWCLSNIKWDGYIYKYGAGLSDGFYFSGGNENDGYWKVTAAGTNVSGTSKTTVVTTNKPIDVTRLKKVTLEAEFRGNNYYGSTYNFGLSTNNNNDSSMVRSICSGSLPGSSNGVGNLDMGNYTANISDLEGEYYIKFYMTVKAYDAKILSIKNLFFE